jgi:hypothetical protein
MSTYGKKDPFPRWLMPLEGGGCRPEARLQFVVILMARTLAVCISVADGRIEGTCGGYGQGQWSS